MSAFFHHTPQLMSFAHLAHLRRVSGNVIDARVLSNQAQDGTWTGNSIFYHMANNLRSRCAVCAYWRRRLLRSASFIPLPMTTIGREHRRADEYAFFQRDFILPGTALLAPQTNQRIWTMLLNTRHRSHRSNTDSQNAQNKSQASLWTAWGLHHQPQQFRVG